VVRRKNGVAGIFEFLRERYPDTVLQLAKRSVDDLIGLTVRDWDLIFYPASDTGSVAIALFDYMLAQDQNFAIRALKTGIALANYNTVFGIRDLVARTKDSAVVGSVLKRLSSSTHTDCFVCIQLAVALLDFNDQAITNRIAGELNENKAFANPSVARRS